MDSILVVASYFDDSRICSVEEADFLMMEQKSHIAAPSCILLVSHANLKVLINSMLKIGSEWQKYVVSFVLSYISKSR